jgi:hypothetical protein
VALDACDCGFHLLNVEGALKSDLDIQQSALSSDLPGERSKKQLAKLLPENEGARF